MKERDSHFHQDWTGKETEGGDSSWERGEDPESRQGQQQTRWTLEMHIYISPFVIFFKKKQFESDFWLLTTKSINWYFPLNTVFIFACLPNSQETSWGGRLCIWVYFCLWFLTHSKSSKPVCWTSLPLLDTMTFLSPGGHLIDKPQSFETVLEARTETTKVSKQANIIFFH